MKKIFLFVFAFLMGQTSLAAINMCGLSIEIDNAPLSAAASFQDILGVYETTCGDVELSFSQRCEDSIYLGMKMSFLDETYGNFNFTVYSQRPSSRRETKYTTRRNSLRIFQSVKDRSLPRSIVDIADFKTSRNGELQNIKTDEYVRSFLGISSRRKRDCRVLNRL